MAFPYYQYVESLKTLDYCGVFLGSFFSVSRRAYEGGNTLSLSFTAEIDSLPFSCSCISCRLYLRPKGCRDTYSEVLPVRPAFDPHCVRPLVRPVLVDSSLLNRGIVVSDSGLLVKAAGPAAVAAADPAGTGAKDDR